MVAVLDGLMVVEAVLAEKEGAVALEVAETQMLIDADAHADAVVGAAAAGAGAGAGVVVVAVVVAAVVVVLAVVGARVVVDQGAHGEMEKVWVSIGCVGPAVGRMVLLLLLLPALLEP